MRVGKMILAWAVAALMAVDSASACRWGWSYCSPAPCYPAYSSCGPVVSYSAADCPICAQAGGAPVTTNRVPAAQPATPTPQPTPQPTLEATPPAAQPAPAEPLPPLDPAAPAQPLPGELDPLTPPADQPAPKPADDIQDLFKDPAPAPTDAPAPGATPAPADTPAAPGEVDDLFKDPAPAAAPDTPAAPGEVDDLFKDPAAPADAAPAEPAAPDNVDDLFKDPSAPAADEPAAKPADNVDNLFKDTGTRTGAGGAVAQARPKATPEELEALFLPPGDEPAAVSADEEQIQALRDEVDKLFSVSASSGQNDPGAMRLWTDNTGKYHVRARLAVVGAAHVRLLKENGKYTTVPFERLSPDDLAFVRSHADSIAASF